MKKKDNHSSTPIDEIPCPFDKVPYNLVPGYESGYGCPVCKSIAMYHIAIPAKETPTTIDEQINEIRATPEGQREMDHWRGQMVMVRDMADQLKKKNVSVREVARRMKTSPSHVHRILNLDSNLKISTLWRFAKALDLDFRIDFCESKHVETFEIPKNDIPGLKELSEQILAMRNDIADLKKK